MCFTCRKLRSFRLWRLGAGEGGERRGTYHGEGRGEEAEGVDDARGDARVGDASAVRKKIKIVMGLVWKCAARTHR
jgi:hypothetical protein